MYSPGRRRHRAKDGDRNLLSCVLNMIVIALLSTALAQPRWFHLSGTDCPRNYLGIYEFFYDDNLKLERNNDDNTSSSNSMQDCITSQIVMMMRVIIVFCFLGILTSFGAFFLDMIGVNHKTLKCLRRNAIGSILTVLFCVTIIGLSYFITTLIEQYHKFSLTKQPLSIEVRFDVGYYLITGGGSIAVLAAAANLLQRRTSNEEEQVDGLLEDYDGLETFSIGYPSRVDVSPMHVMPPPPPYSP